MALSSTRWLFSCGALCLGIGSCTRTNAEGIWRWVDPLTGSEQGVEFCRFASASATSCTATDGAFMAWSPGQPDNDGCSCGLLNLGNCSNAEDCLLVGPSGWTDAACGAARTYLCEDY